MIYQLPHYDAYKLASPPEPEPDPDEEALRERHEALNDFAERAAQQAGVEYEVDDTTLWLGIDASILETADQEWQHAVAKLFTALGGSGRTVEVGGKTYRVRCEEVG